MIKRIVKMTFRQEEVENFIELFYAQKEQIRNFKGCQSLELVRGVAQSNIFFTISIWESEKALEDYRMSELFKTTWAQTKVLFNASPEAWSTEAIVTLH